MQCVHVCVFNIASGLYPLPAAHTNPMWQDPVGQLTLTLYLVMLMRATLWSVPFPCCGLFKAKQYDCSREHHPTIYMETVVKRSRERVPPFIPNKTGFGLCDLVKLDVSILSGPLCWLWSGKCAPINAMHLQEILWVEVITLTVHEVDLQQ